MKRLIILLILFVGVLIKISFFEELSIDESKGIVAGANNELIQGLIIPHHDLANSLSIPVIEKVSQQNKSYPVIVVFSPNHYAPNAPSFTSVEFLGNYKIYKEILEKLIENDIVINSEFMQKEHGFNTPISMLSVAFPNASFLPIAISNNYTFEQLSKLAQFLNIMLPENTLYVASVDFAHNLTLLESLNNNMESINAISNYQYSKILSFSDTHMDSPASITILLELMKLKNRTNWHLESNSHSSYLLDLPTNKGTSYVIGYFD